MSLAISKERELYIAPDSFGDVEFQQRNFGFPVQIVEQETFLKNVFGDFDGHICIFHKRSDGVTNNKFFKNKDFKAMQQYIKKRFGMDTYVSYSTYFKGGRDHKKEVLRTQKNIVHTYMLVQDLDYYKAGISDHQFLQEIGEMVQQGEIICPNYLIFTGRGYQLVWLVEPFKNIAGYTNDKDWRAVQEHLYNKLKRFNSDVVVKNPSAVTRMPDSRHYATKNRVYAFLANEAKLSLKDYVFYYGVVPTADRAVKPKKTVVNPAPAQVTRMVGNWNEFTLNRQREEDIFTFVLVQNDRGKSYVGIRNWLALVLRFHALVSSGGDVDYARNRVVDLCSVVDMSETSEEEILRRSEPAERYYEEWVNDTWDKNKYVRGGLFYTNARMLDLMEIKEDYYVQWKMKTIKIKNKKYEAARKRFEKFSVEEADKHTWAAYQKRRNEKLAEEKEDKLWLLQKAIERHPDWNNKQLAQHLNISLATLKRWKSQL